MYCLRLFIIIYIVYYNVYCYYCGVFIESMCMASFVFINCFVSGPYIGMYRLRLFIVVSQELTM